MIATWLVTDYASLRDLGNVAGVHQPVGLCCKLAAKRENNKYALNLSLMLA